jgi:hypothetical protein
MKGNKKILGNEGILEEFCDSLANYIHKRTTGRNVS